MSNVKAAWPPTVAKPYRAAIGKARSALTTPALILDLDVVRSNIKTMAARLSGPAKLRPQGKSHKCAQIARWQIEAGAIGLTTATVWEATAFAHSGIEDILIANEVVGQEKIRQLAQVARLAHVTVAVDDPRNAEDLSAAVCAAGSEIGILIDVDTGMNRCGVRMLAEALQVAERVQRLPGLHLRGVSGYEGHIALEPERAVRARKAQAAMEYLVSLVDRLAEAGFPMEVVSAGGTGTYDLSSLNPRVTEIQAGSYVFMDAARLPIVPGFAPGLTVLTTVVSRHGTTLVLDGGKKTVGADLALPRLLEFAASPRFASEEHLLFDVEEGCPLVTGDPVEVIPGYAPTTVNLHDVFYVVQNGVVVDVWPVLARGPGKGGAGVVMSDE